MENSKIVWMPFSSEEMDYVPQGLRYEFWDGTGEFPSDPANVSFYVPPAVTEAHIVCKPLPRMSSLEVLHPLSSGVDQYTPYLGQLPATLTLCNSHGIHSSATAELAMGLILASMRRMAEFFTAQQHGRWNFQYTSTLLRKKVLIVGYGSVGSALEERLAPFECEIVRVARRPRLDARGPVYGTDDLPSLLPTADVVVLALPYTRETFHLFGHDFLGLMKDGSLLVNVARGQIVDTEALVKVLEDGRISAALDVTDPEPLPEEHPLWHMPTVVITPHVGAFTSALRPSLRTFIGEQLERYARGEPLRNRLSTEVFQRGH